MQRIQHLRWYLSALMSLALAGGFASSTSLNADDAAEDTEQQASGAPAIDDNTERAAPASSGKASAASAALRKAYREFHQARSEQYEESLGRWKMAIPARPQTWATRLYQACQSRFDARLDELEEDLSGRGIVIKDSLYSVEFKQWDWDDASRDDWYGALHLLVEFSRKTAILHNLFELMPKEDKEKWKGKWPRPMVETIIVAKTNFGNDELHVLRGLDSVKTIDLSNTRVTAEGCDALIDLNGLKEIVLGSEYSSDHSSDDVLLQLRQLEHLTRIELGDCVTCLAVEAFKEQAVGCEVYWPYEEQSHDRCQDRVRKLFRLRSTDFAKDEIPELSWQPLKGQEVLCDKDMPVIAHVVKPEEVEFFTLAGAEITNAGLESLQDFTNLRELNLSGTKISDVGLVSLQGLTSLEKLDLSNTQVKGSGLKSLQRLPNLVELSLSGTKITDDGLVSVGGFKGLTTLRLSQTSLTNACLEHLDGLRLKDVRVDGADVTVDGILKSKLSGLEFLDINGLSEEAKERLRCKFPKVRFPGTA